jgi:uncharacterized protein DUF29
MNAQRSITNTTLYTTDFAAWCLTTADLVRTGQWEAIDPEALAEELTSLGKSYQRELESRLGELLLHLLKWVYQPDRRQDSHSWADSILDQRTQIANLLRDNPSLQPKVPALVWDVYPHARERAIIAIAPQTRHPASGQRDIPALLRGSMLPLNCPWTVTEVLSKDFWPPAVGDPLRGHGHHS